MKFFRAYPVLNGNRYYVPTAQGKKEKAVSEVEKWIAANRLTDEKWDIEVIQL
jgi:hypothetical protein